MRELKRLPDYNHGVFSLALCLPTMQRIRRISINWNKGLLVSRLGRLLRLVIGLMMVIEFNESVNFFDAIPASMRSETL